MSHDKDDVMSSVEIYWYCGSMRIKVFCVDKMSIVLLEFDIEFYFFLMKLYLKWIIIEPIENKHMSAMKHCLET